MSINYNEYSLSSLDVTMKSKVPIPAWNHTPVIQPTCHFADKKSFEMHNFKRHAIVCSVLACCPESSQCSLCFQVSELKKKPTNFILLDLYLHILVKALHFFSLVAQLKTIPFIRCLHNMTTAMLHHLVLAYIKNTMLTEHEAQEYAHNW
jgi:hypothetical protein